MATKGDVCAFLCVHLPDDRWNWQTVRTQAYVYVRLLQEVRSGCIQVKSFLLLLTESLPQIRGTLKSHDV